MKLILRSSGNGIITGICDIVCYVVAFILLTGCASNRSHHDYARLFHVVPGAEREDLCRLASWIAEHDGQLTLPVGGTIHWAETAYYRWYSNDNFTILISPPRFHEAQSYVKWVCGSVQPVERSVGWAMAGHYGLRGPGSYDFPEIILRPERAYRDGVFGAHFGDRRERLLILLKWHVSDQPEGNQYGAFELNSTPEHDIFHFGWLRGYPGIKMPIFLTQDRRVGIISIRMPGSPSLAGLDLMKEDPPVLRQGSIVIDEVLAAKGLRQRPPVTKSQGGASVDHR